MPRSTKSKRAASTTTVTTPTTSNGDSPTMIAPATVDEDTVRELPFTVDISPASEDELPVRSPAGRRRIPSPFEDETKPYFLPKLKGQGWQNQKHDGQVVPENQEEIDADSSATPKYNTTSSVAQSNAKAILREIFKAIRYFNTPVGGDLNLGLDVNVTPEYVQFNVRDKQKRSRNKSSEIDDGDVQSFDEDEDYGEDLDDDDNGDE